MTHRVLLTQEAEGQFLVAHNWWLQNRPASPNLLVDEFEELVSLLKILPEAGHLFRRATIPGVRRVLLRESDYWLYYVPDRPHSVVFLLAVWSAHRGSDPPL
jgi:hypothetical protein